MTEYEQLRSFLNAFMVAIAQAMADLSLGIPLIWTQMSKAFGKGARDLLRDVGIEMSGNDVHSIVGSFVNAIKSAGLCKRVNLLEESDSKLVVDIGECVLSPATKKLAESYPNLIPPCPMLGILANAIESATGKRSRLEHCEYNAKDNARIFTVSLD